MMPLSNSSSAQRATLTRRVTKILLLYRLRKVFKALSNLFIIILTVFFFFNWSFLPYVSRRSRRIQSFWNIPAICARQNSFFRSRHLSLFHPSRDSFLTVISVEGLREEEKKEFFSPSSVTVRKSRLAALPPTAGYTSEQDMSSAHTWVDPWHTCPASPETWEDLGGVRLQERQMSEDDRQFSRSWLRSSIWETARLD